MITHATDPKTARSARTRKDSTPTKSKTSAKNEGTPRKNPTTARKNTATARKNGDTAPKNGGSARKNGDSPPTNAGALPTNAEPAPNYETTASNIPVPFFDPVALPPPRRTGRQVDDLPLVLERAEVRLRWAWSERTLLDPALPADFHAIAWTALTLLRASEDETLPADTTFADTLTNAPAALVTPAARALETLRERLQVIRSAVEFTTRPGDAARDALRFGTVLRTSRALLKLAPVILRGARTLQSTFPALTDDVIAAADKALVVARKAVARARQQGVAGSVTRGAAAEREQRALDVLLDRIDHLRAAALTKLAPVKPTLAALLMAPLEVTKPARTSDAEPTDDDTNDDDTNDDTNDA